MGDGIAAAKTRNLRARKCKLLSFYGTESRGPHAFSRFRPAVRLSHVRAGAGEAARSAISTECDLNHIKEFRTFRHSSPLDQENWASEQLRDIASNESRDDSLPPAVGNRRRKVEQQARR